MRLSLPIFRRLGGCGLFLVEIREFLAFLRQALQERSRLPKFAMPRVKFLNALADLFQSNRVGIPHRPAAIGREAVAVEVNDVDIHRAQGDAFLENARALVDQSVDAAVKDLFLGNLPLWNTSLGGPLADQFGDLWIGDGAPIFVILVPARAGFLAIAAQFAKLVTGKRVANPRLLEVSIFLPNSPADIEARKIAHGERAHGHTKIIKCAIDRFYACTFFEQKNGFAHIGMKHTVADKSAAISRQNADLAEPFRKLHAGGDHFLTACLATNDLE